jgi:hypothetical protein
MYADHQTQQEESERPEGSIKNLVAEFVSDARWDSAGLNGPGLYADAKVFEHWKPFVEELAPHIGVSIRASGKARPGEIEGKRVPVIEEIVNARSVDFVTTPGAGGQVLTLFEAARTRAQQITPGGEGDVDEQKLQEAQAARDAAETKLKEAESKLTEAQTEIETLKAENARLREGEILREAKAVVAKALPEDLADVTKTRLLEALSKNPPVKDGALDKDALTATVTEAVKAEVEYLAKISESGRIKGMGGTPAPADKTALKETWKAKYRSEGYSEEQATQMAEIATR